MPDIKDQCCTTQVVSTAVNGQTDQSIVGKGDQLSTDPIMLTLGSSVALLVLVSYLKYHVEKNNKETDYWLYFLELPIDFGTIVISILISYNYLVKSIEGLFIAIVIELLSMVIGMTFRKSAEKILEESDNSLNRKDLVWRMILEFAIILISSVLLLYITLN